MYYNIVYFLPSFLRGSGFHHWSTWHGMTLWRLKFTVCQCKSFTVHLLHVLTTVLFNQCCIVGWINNCRIHPMEILFTFGLCFCTSRSFRKSQSVFWGKAWIVLFWVFYWNCAKTKHLAHNVRQWRRGILCVFCGNFCLREHFRQ